MDKVAGAVQDLNDQYANSKPPQPKIGDFEMFYSYPDWLDD